MSRDDQGQSTEKMSLQKKYSAKSVIELHPNKVPNFREFESPEDRAIRLRGLADYLIEIATLIAQDELDRDPHAVMLALVDAEGPAIYWKGFKTWEEIREINDEIDDRYRAAQWPSTKEGESTVQRVRRNKKESKRDQDAYLHDHPWLCESDQCRRRFKTERGVRIHERSCHYMTRRDKVVQ